MSKAEEINERLIGEYISKVRCCDECFASVYCTVNGLRESRVPQEYCIKNIKRYFGDNAKPVEERPHGEWIEDIRSMICEVNDYYGYTDSMHMFKVLFDQKYHGWKKEGDEK